MVKKRKISLDKMPEGFYWFNEPGEYSFAGDSLEIITDSQTDFWQRTHYGFRRDNGHSLLITMKEDFSLTAQTSFNFKGRYDQCGLYLRIDQENWIKVSVEAENEKISRLGSVVTNLGYSDWATTDITANTNSMWYRISKRGQDYLIENSVDGEKWLQMRLTHLHLNKPVDVGIYACSPEDNSFKCTINKLILIGEEDEEHLLPW